MSMLGKKQLKRIAVDIAGFGLIFVSPFVSLLPGPGGLPVFIAGLGILSLNYDWAKNLLKNFDKRYNDFVNKYLVGNKKIAHTIDVLSLIIITTGIYTLTNAENIILKVFSFGLISFGGFIVISNQKRLEKILKKLKSKHKQK